MYLLFENVIKREMYYFLHYTLIFCTLVNAKNVENTFLVENEIDGDAILHI